MNSSYPHQCMVAAARWVVKQSILMTQHSQPSPSDLTPSCMFVPDSTRSQVRQWGHSSKLVCHLGFQRTLSLNFKHFWWLSVYADTKESVSVYFICANGKASHRGPAGLLRPLPVPHRHWPHIVIDIVTRLPPSESNTAILTIMDRFSKAVKMFSLPKLLSSLETANLLVLHVFMLHGVSMDRWLQIISQVWRAFCQAIDASVSLSITHSPMGRLSG